jgi:hypothetical protein
MRNPLAVEVIQGQIPVDSVDVLIRRRNLLVMVVNTHSKYAGATVSYAGNSEPAVHLYATERTLRARPDVPSSLVVLPRYTRGWHVLSESHGKNSVTVVAWRSGHDEWKEQQEIWRSDVEHGARNVPGGQPADTGDHSAAGSDTRAAG